MGRRYRSSPQGNSRKREANENRESEPDENRQYPDALTTPPLSVRRAPNFGSESRTKLAPVVRLRSGFRRASGLPLLLFFSIHQVVSPATGPLHRDRVRLAGTKKDRCPDSQGQRRHRTRTDCPDIVPQVHPKHPILEVLYRVGAERCRLGHFESCRRR
jgi:hypothetical protein